MYLHVCLRCGWSWVNSVPDTDDPCPMCPSQMRLREPLEYLLEGVS